MRQLALRQLAHHLPPPLFLLQDVTNSQWNGVSYWSLKTQSSFRCWRQESLQSSFIKWNWDDTIYGDPMDPPTIFSFHLPFSFCNNHRSLPTSPPWLSSRGMPGHCLTRGPRIITALSSILLRPCPNFDLYFLNPEPCSMASSLKLVSDYLYISGFFFSSCI